MRPQIKSFGPNVSKISVMLGVHPDEGTMYETFSPHENLTQLKFLKLCIVLSSVKEEDGLLGSAAKGKGREPSTLKVVAIQLVLANHKAFRLRFNTPRHYEEAEGQNLFPVSYLIQSRFPRGEESRAD